MLAAHLEPGERVLPFLADQVLIAAGDRLILAQDRGNFLVQEIVQDTEIRLIEARLLRVQYRIAPNGCDVHPEHVLVDKIIGQSTPIDDFLHGGCKFLANFDDIHRRQYNALVLVVRCGAGLNSMRMTLT